MARAAGALPLLLLLLLLARSCEARSSMHAKCSACRAVAEVLIQRLEEEVPRNHLDLRHRLDKEGKRWGKVIDYKMSELRVIHLLEGLCDGMTKYEFVEEKKTNETTEPARWARTDSLGSGRSREVFRVKEQRKELENFCHDLLERHEETLSHALRAGQVSVENASDFLCFITAQHCDEPVPAAAATPYDEAEEAIGSEAAGEGQEGQGAGQQAQQADPAAGTAATAAAGSAAREEL